MKLVLTGATGFAGGEVLQQALADPAIGQVTAIVRRPMGMKHAKLKEIVLADFLGYTKVADQLQADACLWCLGVSQTEVSEVDYIKITVDYTLAAARAMLAINPALRFCFLSGRAADPEEKSKVLYGRIKGRTERELWKLIPGMVTFRPAFIKKARPGQKRPLIPAMFEPIAWVVDRFTDDFSVDAGTLAQCLLDVAKNGLDRRVVTNREMRRGLT